MYMYTHLKMYSYYTYPHMNHLVYSQIVSVTLSVLISGWLRAINLPYHGPCVTVALYTRLTEYTMCVYTYMLCKKYVMIHEL